MQIMFNGPVIVDRSTIPMMNEASERLVKLLLKVNLRRLSKVLAEQHLEDPIFQGIFMLQIILLPLLMAHLNDLLILASLMKERYRYLPP